MEVNIKNNRIRDLETFIVLAAILLIVSHLSHNRVFMTAAFALLVVSLTMKGLTSRLAGLWLKFAEIIGSFNSKIILSLVFFLFLSPLAFIYRIFNRNALGIESATTTHSLFVLRDHTYVKEDLEKMW